jgi:outer membrane immunogenic protein
VGYLILPQLLAYVSGGYTQTNFQGFELFSTDDGDPVNWHIPAHKWNGWFIGSGYEYAPKWLPDL